MGDGREEESEECGLMFQIVKGCFRKVASCDTYFRTEGVLICHSVVSTSQPWQTSGGGYGISYLLVLAHNQKTMLVGKKSEVAQMVI